MFRFLDENLEILTKKIDGVGLLMMTLKNHASHAKVIKNACLALASLIEPEGKECKMNILHKSSSTSHYLPA